MDNLYVLVYLLCDRKTAICFEEAESPPIGSEQN